MRVILGTCCPDSWQHGRRDRHHPRNEVDRVSRPDCGRWRYFNSWAGRAQWVVLDRRAADGTVLLCAADIAFLGADQPRDSRIGAQLRCRYTRRQVHPGRTCERRAVGGRVLVCAGLRWLQPVKDQSRQSNIHQETRECIGFRERIGAGAGLQAWPVATHQTRVASESKRQSVNQDSCVTDRIPLHRFPSCERDLGYWNAVAHPLLDRACPSAAPLAYYLLSLHCVC